MLRALNTAVLALLALALAAPVWAQGAPPANGPAAGAPAPAAARAAPAANGGQAVQAAASDNLSPQATVRVLARTEVAGDEFTLEDVADVDGSDADLVRRLGAVSLGHSPQPGRTLRLSAPYLRSRLAAVVSADQVKLVMPPDAEVVRASQVISGDDIAKQVLSRTIKLSGADTGDVQQQLVSPIDDAVLPTGKITWNVQPLGHYGSVGGARTFRVVAKVGGHEVWRTIARVEQDVFRKVIVAAHTLSRNQVIRPQDVKQMRQSVNGRKPDSYLTALAKVVGSRAKRPIGTGEWINKTMLAAVPDVNEGGPVMLVYQTEDVRFTSPGVALVPAKIGQFIPVRNLESGKIVYGVVQANQLVKVN